jgi:hypothetical protein
MLRRIFGPKRNKVTEDLRKCMMMSSGVYNLPANIVRITR